VSGASRCSYALMSHLPGPVILAGTVNLIAGFSR
jgi:hypothetical protein